MRLLRSDQPYQNDIAPVLNLSPNLVSKEGHRWNKSYRKEICSMYEKVYDYRENLFSQNKSDNNWLLKFCYEQKEYRRECIETIRNREQASN